MSVFLFLHNKLRLIIKTIIIDMLIILFIKSCIWKKGEINHSANSVSPSSAIIKMKASKMTINLFLQAGFSILKVQGLRNGKLTTEIFADINGIPSVLFSQQAFQHIFW